VEPRANSGDLDADSVVWFSQRLTPLLGMDRSRRISRADYGNQDMSGGLTKACSESSLVISPDEQLKFWSVLERGCRCRSMPST
jgi:beta-lactamase class D